LPLGFTACHTVTPLNFILWARTPLLQVCTEGPDSRVFLDTVRCRLVGDTLRTKTSEWLPGMAHAPGVRWRTLLGGTRSIAAWSLTPIDRTYLSALPAKSQGCRAVDAKFECICRRRLEPGMSWCLPQTNIHVLQPDDAPLTRADSFVGALNIRRQAPLLDRS
jgi:hypothetical protein